MLSIDNAVELTIKTFLGLPRRVTGIKLSRADHIAMSESFPRLLDKLEEVAGQRLVGIDLGEIEWYHRLRNELYHNGNGLTVERDKVDVYAELAKLLFRNLFGRSLYLQETPGSEILGDFMSSWLSLEKETVRLAGSLGGVTAAQRSHSLQSVLQDYVHEGLLDRKTADDIVELRTLRNSVVHGLTQPNELRHSTIERINDITEKLRRLQRRKPRR